MLTHPLIVDGWFREISERSFPGQSFGLKVEKILYSKKSAFQDILVFQSSNFGNVLVLDGIIQCTERDEFAYQEMITHVAMFAHRSPPRRVLVIGGGDGGVIREVLKHPSVEVATLVEIDDTVINLSEKYFPQMSCSLKDDRTEIVMEDGFQFLQKLSKCSQDNKYDVIITDSTDPEGPAENFFKESYFQLLNNALAPNGLTISMASENIWLDINRLANLRKDAARVFPVAKICTCMIPSYTSGQISLLCCSQDGTVDVSHPSRHIDNEDQMFKYYNSAIHSASFILPTWAKDIIYK